MNTDWCIREWEHLPIGHGGVTEVAADKLQVISDRISRQLRAPGPVLARTVRPSLKADQIVGVLSVPSARVEILPRIDGPNRTARTALVHMLAAVRDFPVADSELARLSAQDENLLEVIITLFANRLLTEVRRGLPRRYRTKEDDLPFLRGKLDINRQVSRHALRTDLLACGSNDLSADVPLNRILKAAVARLLTVSRKTANLHRLTELATRLEFVGTSRNPLQEPVQLDRTNAAFHRLYLWARFLLADEWQSTTSGAQEGFSLLFRVCQKTP